MMIDGVPHPTKAASLRGATRRSNPDCFRGQYSGLLRCARNDVARVVRIPAMRKLPVVHIFACAVGQITTIIPRVSLPQEGRFAIVTDVGSGMRWTRRVVRRTT
jgi:hypothetical protein